MVPGHIRVNVQPQSFDLVALRAVRRKKVQSESLAVVGDPVPRQAPVVDAVVIQHQVNQTLAPLVTNEMSGRSWGRFPWLELMIGLVDHLFCRWAFDVGWQASWTWWFFATNQAFMGSPFLARRRQVVPSIILS